MPTLDDVRSATTKILLPLTLLVLVFAAFASAQTGIAVGQTVDGNLSASSGRSAVCAECFADLYEFSVSSTQELLISLDSEEFDAYLRVFDASVILVFEDDDGGPGSNSEILEIFAPGTYRIEASTFSDGESGAYTLSLETITAPVVRPISVGQTVSGTLTTDSGRSVGCARCFADLYEFNITSTENLEVALRSVEFDAFLRVLDVNGDTVISDDDGGGGTDSRIERSLAPGTYFIETTT